MKSISFFMMLGFLGVKLMWFLFELSDAAVGYFCVQIAFLGVLWMCAR